MTPKWSPKMMPTWLYRQDFAKFSLNRHYNARWSGVGSIEVSRTNPSADPAANASTCDLRTAFCKAWADVEVGATPVALAYRHVLVQRPHLLSGPLFPPGERFTPPLLFGWVIPPTPFSRIGYLEGTGLNFNSFD
ncbi:hypothetical protein TNCV_3805971 [Trichonephila clavipes]|nr:hypothetical protein TNCV_3805971 [Trichonephila clavipes]